MKKYGLIAIVLLALYSCADQLEKTVFIPDKDDSNLPAYTEWGYNSFGAQYERTYFLASPQIVPCKITYQDGILHFALLGRLGAGYHSPDMEMALTFSFPVSLIKEYRDLTVLNNVEIDLTDASCEVKIEKDGTAEIIKPLSGYLLFKRIQLLRVDSKEDRIILSGLFDILFLHNNLPEHLSNGRFDLGVNQYFFSFH